MKAHCPGCHADTEVPDTTQAGEVVQCGQCLMKFQAPRIVSVPAAPGADHPLVTLLSAVTAPEFEAQLSGIIEPDVFERVKERAVEAFGAFMAELEADETIDVEAIGKKCVELIETYTPAVDASVTDASDDAAGFPAEAINDPLEVAIRLAVREEIDEAFGVFGDEFAKDIAGLFDPDWVPVHLMIDGDEPGANIVVTVNVDDQWVPIIETNLGGLVSHIVEPAGIQAAVDRAREQKRPAGDAADDTEQLEEKPIDADAPAG